MEETTQIGLIEKLKKAIAHRQYLFITGILLTFIGVVTICVTQSEKTPFKLTINRAKFCSKTIPNSTSSSAITPLQESSNEFGFLPPDPLENFVDTAELSDEFSLLDSSEGSGDLTTLRNYDQVASNTNSSSTLSPSSFGDVSTLRNYELLGYTTESIDDYIGES